MLALALALKTPSLGSELVLGAALILTAAASVRVTVKAALSVAAATEAEPGGDTLPVTALGVSMGDMEERSEVLAA